MTQVYNGQSTGVVINAACTSAKNVDKMFMRLNLRPDLDSWIDSADYYMSEILIQTKFIESEEIGDSMYPAIFPKNTESCNNYCEFIEYCTHTKNPLLDIDSPPHPFKVNFWNPAAKESNRYMEV